MPQKKQIMKLCYLRLNSKLACILETVMYTPSLTSFIHGNQDDEQDDDGYVSH